MMSRSQALMVLMFIVPSPIREEEGQSVNDSLCNVTEAAGGLGKRSWLMHLRWTAWIF